MSMRGVINLLNAAASFALIPHVNPDADALGSCFAMAAALYKMGKTAVVYTEEELPDHLLFLGGEYELYSGDTPPAYDVCLCIDCGDIQRLGEREAIFSAAKHTVNIDHHDTNTNFADYNIVDASASSCGEMCCELLACMGTEMDLYIATCLYAAISSDTGGFRYSNTTASAMHTAADLLKYGVDTWKINRLLLETESIQTLHLKGIIAQNVRLYENGLISAVSVSRAVIESFGLTSDQLDGIVDIARRVRGSEVAAAFKESEQGIRVSLRSNEYIDVGSIALRFGGGGHKRAAGLTMEGDLKSAEDIIIGALTEEIRKHHQKRVKNT